MPVFQNLIIGVSGDDNRKIQELQLELAAHQTMRNAYAKALTDMLNQQAAKN